MSDERYEYRVKCPYGPGVTRGDKESVFERAYLADRSVDEERHPKCCNFSPHLVERRLIGEWEKV